MDGLTEGWETEKHVMRLCVAVLLKNPAWLSHVIQDGRCALRHKRRPIFVNNV
jgi:hypothetical protein